jgi:hypothetical protein
MVRLRYDASVRNHSFIPISFLDSHKSTIKEMYLPLPENLVFEDEGKAADLFPLYGRRTAPSLKRRKCRAKELAGPFSDTQRFIKECPPLKYIGKTKMPSFL